MSIYSLKEEKGQGLILFIDGLQSTCPYQQPIPTQGSYGQVGLLRIPCSTTCPMAEHKPMSKTYAIKCGGETIHHNITETEKPLTIVTG
jgi:hypothetical protein